MQQIKNKKTFIVDKKTKIQTDFERAVSETAALIDRTYFVTFKMVEDWQLHKILRRLNEAKASANPPRYWWGMRKKDKEKL